MKPYLIVAIFVASCKATMPLSSTSDGVPQTMSPGTAFSNVLIIEYEDIEDGLQAKGKIKKTYKYGAGTSVIAPRDTIAILINNNTIKSSGIEEAELIDKIHTGKSMKMLLKEPEKMPVSEKQAKLASWEVLKLIQE